MFLLSSTVKKKADGPFGPASFCLGHQDVRYGVFLEEKFRDHLIFCLIFRSLMPSRSSADRYSR